jgi:hypothetical protein
MAGVAGKLLAGSGMVSVSTGVTSLTASTVRVACGVGVETGGMGAEHPASRTRIMRNNFWTIVKFYPKWVIPGSLAAPSRFGPRFSFVLRTGTSRFRGSVLFYS